MTRAKLFAAFALASLAFLAEAQAQVSATGPVVTSEYGSVRQLVSGWADNAMSVFHNAPMANPAGCAITTAGYATAPTDPGVDLFHSMLIAAFHQRTEVALIVQGCAYGKPRVIGVAYR